MDLTSECAHVAAHQSNCGTPPRPRKFSCSGWQSASARWRSLTAQYFSHLVPWAQVGFTCSLRHPAVVTLSPNHVFESRAEVSFF